MGGRNNVDPIYSVHTMPNTLHVIERLASAYLHKSNYVHEMND